MYCIRSVFTAREIRIFKINHRLHSTSHFPDMPCGSKGGTLGLQVTSSPPSRINPNERGRPLYCSFSYLIIALYIASITASTG